MTTWERIRELEGLIGKTERKMERCDPLTYRMLSGRLDHLIDEWRDLLDYVAEAGIKEGEL